MSSVRARRGPHLAASGVPQKSLEFEGMLYIGISQYSVANIRSGRAITGHLRRWLKLQEIVLRYSFSSTYYYLGNEQEVPGSNPGADENVGQ